MTKLSKPKLFDNNRILFPQGFWWNWEGKNQAVSSYEDIVGLWKLGQVRGAVIGAAATTVLIAAGIGVYKIIKAKKHE